MKTPGGRGENDRVWIIVFILILFLGVALIAIAALLSPLHAHPEDRGAWPSIEQLHSFTTPPEN